MDMDTNFSCDDDDDDQLFSMLELDKIIELDKVKSDLTELDKKDHSSVKFRKLPAVGSKGDSLKFPKDDCVIPVKNIFSGQRSTASQIAMPPPPQPIPVIPVRKIVNEKFMEVDGDWRKFLQWVDAQKIFDTPWCKVVPISVLNISQCKTLVLRMKDEHVDEQMRLIQLAKIIFSFLKDIYCLSDESTDSYQELVQILQMTFVRIEEISNLGKLQPPSKKKLDELIPQILETYMTGEMDFGTCPVVNILIRLYPVGLDKILRSSLQSGSPRSLLPLCLNSQENFSKILNLLNDYSNSFESFDEDQDFQLSPVFVHKFSRKLLDLLRKSLNRHNFINNFPSHFQPLVSLNVTIFENPRYYEDEMIGNEMLGLLNDVVKCIDCGFGDNFVYFFISIMPICLKMLSEMWSNKLIKFKEFPSLWQFAKEHDIEIKTRLYAK